MGGDDLSMFQLTWGCLVGSFVLKQEPGQQVDGEYTENHDQGDTFGLGVGPTTDSTRTSRGQRMLRNSEC